MTNDHNHPPFSRRRLRQLVEQYLYERRYLNVIPRNHIQQTAMDLAEDLEDNENIPPNQQHINN